MQALVVAFFSCLALRGQNIEAGDYGVTPNTFTDITANVRRAIEACRDKPHTTINFPTGRYDFWPENAEETSYYITNSSSEEEYPVKKQRVGLLFKHLKNIRIEGNHSLFVFHGKMITWVFDSCENIRLQNIFLDYERPGMSEMTIQKVSPGSVLARIHPDSKFTIINDTLEWYGEKWVSRNFHAILANPVTGVNLYSSWDPFLKSKAAIIAPLTVQFTGDFSTFRASPGDILTIRDRYRDYVGAFINRSKNISLHNVHMQFMHGLGIVSQFSENLYYDSVFVEPAKNSGRVMASSADGMHFSGCKGQVTIDHCRFKGLHDDPVNVHGTHLKITEIVSPTLLKIRFMHGQTYGFEAFFAGDTIAFVHPASLQIFENGIVKTARLISEREMLVELNGPFSRSVVTGDVLENVTCTPAFTLTNSRIEGTNTRGVLVTTRRKVVIENNIFYRTGMHAILIANDASDWYESGPVEDVTIRHNVFEDCASNSFPNNYIINISPQNHQLVPGYWVHKNILIDSNLFKVYDYPLLFARSVNGLRFINNDIIQTNFMEAGDKRPAIHIEASARVMIKKNKFKFDQLPTIALDLMKDSDIDTDISYQKINK